MIYYIQKLAHRRLDPLSDGGGIWVEAFGLNEKSWPEASTDKEAIEKFYVATAKAKSPRRLIILKGAGLGTYATVLATAHFPKSQEDGFARKGEAGKID